LIMAYFQKIRALTKEIPAELVDFSQPRDAARTPTQVFDIENLTKILEIKSGYF